MPGLENFDWSSGSEEEQLSAARACDNRGLCQLARTYDWGMYPEKVLGWMMAQKNIDLETALIVFLNGEPERFNYIPKRDVPEELRGAARVLDNICLRVNSGFYLAYPETNADSWPRINKWLSYQAADRKEGRRGRWILDETILKILIDDTFHLDPAKETAVYHENPSLLKDLLSPVADLGVSRRMLKFLPKKD